MHLQAEDAVCILFEGRDTRGLKLRQASQDHTNLKPSFPGVHKPMQTKESAHAADLWSFEFHWIDVALPQEAPALTYDSSAQTLLDGLILKIIKSADADAAKAMCALSLGFAAAQSTLAARVFWKICSAYFEALALGLCPLDVYAKRAASQILLTFLSLIHI